MADDDKFEDIDELVQEFEPTGDQNFEESEQQVFEQSVKL